MQKYHTNFDLYLKILECWNICHILLYLLRSSSKIRAADRKQLLNKASDNFQINTAGRVVSLWKHNSLIPRRLYTFLSLFFKETPCPHPHRCPKLNGGGDLAMVWNLHFWKALTKQDSLTLSSKYQAWGLKKWGEFFCYLALFAERFHNFPKKDSCPLEADSISLQGVHCTNTSPFCSFIRPLLST